MTAADTIPIPVDPRYGLVRAVVTNRPGERDDRGRTLWRAAWWHEGGRRPEIFTDPLAWPAAVSLVRDLNARLDPPPDPDLEDVG